METWKIEIDSKNCPFRNINYLCRYVDSMIIICGEKLKCPIRVKDGE